jgi:hypothetical protein
MVTSRDPVGNRNRRAPAHSPPCSTTNQRVTGRPTPPAPDSSPPPGVVRWWPFRAQLPVRTAAPPEGAFSAQTPPARPFSYPAPTFPPALMSDGGIPLPAASVCAQSPPYLTPTGVGCPRLDLPSARPGQGGADGVPCRPVKRQCPAPRHSSATASHPSGPGCHRGQDRLLPDRHLPVAAPRLDPHAYTTGRTLTDEREIGRKSR